MLRKRLLLFVFNFSILFGLITASWFEECPDRRKSLGRCLAGLCPFEAECINDHCCKLDTLGESLFYTLLKLAGESPKLPSVKPPAPSDPVVTEKPSIEVATVPPKSAESVEIPNKPLTSEEFKGVLSTTTTTKKPKTKGKGKRGKTTVTTTSTTTHAPIEVTTEDPLCFDGSYSIGECMDGFCPTGYNCENGYCCKWLKSLPYELTPLPQKPTNILTIAPGSFETSSGSSEEDNSSSSSSEEGEDINSEEDSLPSSSEEEGPRATIANPKITTLKPDNEATTLSTSTTTSTSQRITTQKVSTLAGSSPPSTSTTTTTTTVSPTTTEDYQTKDVCLIGYPIGECVDNKCPTQHECVQGYCCEITPAINCSDLLRSCKKTLCEKPQYFDFMTENCGRSCLRCDRQTGNPRPKKPKRCRDSRSDCPDWVAEGFCKSALYSLEQKQYLCGKSCKLCS